VRVFPTVHALAEADVTRYVRGGRTEFPGIGPDTLAKLQARAALLVQPQASPVLPRAGDTAADRA